MARTPRKTAKADQRSLVATQNPPGNKSHGDSGDITGLTAKHSNEALEKEGKGKGHLVGKKSKRMAVVEATVVVAPRTRSSARISDLSGSLSVASTRAATRKAQAKGKNTLMRRVFHNLDGSLRGVGVGSTPAAQSPSLDQAQAGAQSSPHSSVRSPCPIQPHTANNSIKHTTKVEKLDITKLAEPGKPKSKDWCFKSKEGVTFENAVEVFEKNPRVVGCGEIPETRVKICPITGEGNQQKLPPVFQFDQPYSSSVCYTDNSITHNNAAEACNHGPYLIDANIDPELLIQDDERFGVRPPVQDKIWFMESPFRTTSLFESEKETPASTTFRYHAVTYFATSDERGLVNVEPAGTTLDVTMDMEKTSGSKLKRKREIQCGKPKNDIKLMSGENGWSSFNEMGNGLPRGGSLSANEGNLYDGKTALDEDSELAEFTDEDHARPPSPRFL